MINYLVKNPFFIPDPEGLAPDPENIQTTNLININSLELLQVSDPKLISKPSETSVSRCSQALQASGGYGGKPYIPKGIIGGLFGEPPLLNSDLGGVGGISNNGNILALDLGTTTGWAIKHLDSSIVSGVMSFKPGRFEGRGMCFLRFQQWLEEMNKTVSGIDMLYFEEVRRHLGTDAAHIYGGFLAQLTAWCEYRQIPYSGVGVGTIKKFITGKGNASKEEVIEAIRKLGHSMRDHNEADALALLYFAINKWKN
ncbi:hypothetical protein I862_07415 [endosymbiont of Acanthamoeba sp. UWC8]|nr:hypothetical protein [endosymbiont of Acanthamoeba sp. UWC8]AIF82037.1 hypothetical protein I862_07415 [endosymbiont of Acanthamoeba sp. UWC8]